MQCNPLVRRDLPNLAEHLYLVTNLHLGFTSQLVTVWRGEGFIWALTQGKTTAGESRVLVFWFKLGLPSCSPVGLVLGCSPLSFPPLRGSWNAAVRTAGWCYCNIVLCLELKPSLQQSLKRRVGVKGNIKALLFLCTHVAWPLKLGAATLLNWHACWRSSKLGFRPCRWGGCIALVLGDFEFL